MSDLNFPPCQVKWQDIYGEVMPTLPEGWEYCGWGMVTIGQSYQLPPIVGTAIHTPYTTDTLPSGPRLLVRRKKTKRIVFTQVGERVPNMGEWLEHQASRMMFQCTDGFYSSRPVFARTEEEV